MNYMISSKSKALRAVIILVWAFGLWYMLHHKVLFKEWIDLFCIGGYFYFGKSAFDFYELNKKTKTNE